MRNNNNNRNNRDTGRNRNNNTDTGRNRNNNRYTDRYTDRNTDRNNNRNTETDSFTISSDHVELEPDKQQLLDYDELVPGGHKDCGYEVDGYFFYEYLKDCECKRTYGIPKQFLYFHHIKCIEQSNDAKNFVAFAMRKNYDPLFLCRDYRSLLDKIDHLNIGYDFKNINEASVAEKIYTNKTSSSINEYIQKNKPTALFVDIDFKNTDNISTRLRNTLDKLKSILRAKSIHTFVCILQGAHAHTLNHSALCKGSYHITIRFYTEEHQEIIFDNPTTMISALKLLGIYNLDGVDHAVYPQPDSGHFLRSINSIKLETNKKALKPFDRIPLVIDHVYSENLDYYDKNEDKRIYTFPQYRSYNSIIVPSEKIENYFTTEIISNTISVNDLLKFCNAYMLAHQVKTLNIKDSNTSTLLSVFTILVEKEYYLEVNTKHTIYCRKKTNRPFEIRPLTDSMPWEYSETHTFADDLLTHYKNKMRKYTNYNFTLDLTEKQLEELLVELYPLKHAINNEFAYIPFLNGALHKETDKVIAYEELNKTCIFTYRIKLAFEEPTNSMNVTDVTLLDVLISKMLFSVNSMMIVVCKDNTTVQCLTQVFSSIYTESKGRIKTARLEELGFNNDIKYDNINKCILLLDNEIHLKSIPHCDSTLLVISEESTKIIKTTNTIKSTNVINYLEMDGMYNTEDTLLIASRIYKNLKNYECLLVQNDPLKIHVFKWLTRNIEIQENTKLCYADIIEKYKSENGNQPLENEAQFKRIVHDYVCNFLFFDKPELRSMRTHKNSENIPVKYWMNIKFVNKLKT